MSLFSELESKVLTRFSSRRRLLSGGELSESTFTSLTPQLVVGRDYCRYLGLELGHVPKGQRSQALESQLLAFSMWDNTDYCVAWNNSFAQVWFWDAEKVSQQIQQQLTGIQQATSLRSSWMLAETTLWNKPAKAGLYLLHCKNGYDLQYWHGGNLVASQWFSEEPGQDKVRRFTRSQAIEHDVPPDTVRPVENENVWPGVTRPGNVGGESLRKKLVAGCATVFVLVLLLQIIAVVRWSMIENKYLGLREELEVSSVGVLEDRAVARQMRDDYENLVQLFMVPDSLNAQSQVADRLPAELGLSLVRWERNVNEVEMTVAGEIVDSLSLVQQLNEAQGISGASVEDSRTSGRSVIRLTLQGPSGTPVTVADVPGADQASDAENSASEPANESSSQQGAQPTSGLEPGDEVDMSEEMFEEMFGVPL